MLKKAGVVAAAAAGLIMLGAPAFASTASLQGEGWDHHDGQVGLVNVSNVDILHKIWTSRSDEALTPEVRYSYPVSSRLIIDACRSYAHRATHTAVCQFDRDFKQQIADKWQL